MLDTIKNIFRHPAFDALPGGENRRAFGAFRPIREYAADGVAYVQRDIAVWDFAKHGGATGEINLNTVSSGRPLGITFPDNAILVDGLIIVDTAFVGPTATIAVGTTAGSAADSLKAALAVASWATDAVLPLIPLGHGTGEVKLSAAGSLSITIATAALTAGKAYFVIDWIGGTN